MKVIEYLTGRWEVIGHKRGTKLADKRIGYVDALRRSSALSKAKRKYDKKWTIVKIVVRR